MRLCPPPPCHFQRGRRGGGGGGGDGGGAGMGRVALEGEVDFSLVSPAPPAPDRLAFHHPAHSSPRAVRGCEEQAENK